MITYILTLFGSCAGACCGYACFQTTADAFLARLTHVLMISIILIMYFFLIQFGSKLIEKLEKMPFLEICNDI